MILVVREMGIKYITFSSVGGIGGLGCSSMLFSVPLRSLAGYPSDCPTPVGFCEVRQRVRALSGNTLAQLVLLTWKGLN